MQKDGIIQPTAYDVKWQERQPEDIAVLMSTKFVFVNSI